MKVRSAEGGRRKAVVYKKSSFFRTPRSAFRIAWLLAGCSGICSVSRGAEIPLRNEVVVSTSLADIDDLDKPVQLVEQEFDPALLNNLPLPELPPPQVSLPRVIVEKGQWRGSQCGITRPSHLVIRQTDIWAKFWGLAISPYSVRLKNTPAVDFSKDMVVGIFMGEKPNPGYQIEIRSVKTEKEDAERVLVVRYRNIQKMQAVFNPPFTVQPFHLIKTPAFPGRVAFLEAGNSLPKGPTIRCD